MLKRLLFLGVVLAAAGSVYVWWTFPEGEFSCDIVEGVLGIGPHGYLPLSTFRIENPWVVPKVTSPSGWRDIQSGRFAIVPQYDVLFVVEHPWENDAAAHLALIQAMQDNLSEERLMQPIPPFVLLQVGDGVGGLREQILVPQTGDAYIWAIRPDYDAPDPDVLPLSEFVSVDADAAGKIVDLARKAIRRMGETRIEYSCRMIDGLTVAMTVFDGENAGRIQYSNSRVPTASHQELFDRIEALVRGETQKTV